jgi:O-acetyl-ADP-ribose deacetylase (regulator of RNase III)
MAPGEVLITNAGKHPHARYVAHAAVMDYRQGFTGSSYPTLELVEKSYARIWQELAKLGERNLSVAVVALGAGTGKLGVRGPVEKACRTLKAFLEGPGADAIGDISFFGYNLVEYIATVEMVSNYFQLPPDSILPEVAAHLEGR